MRCKIYSVIVCILYALLVVTFVQGFQLPHPNVQTNVEEATTNCATDKDMLIKLVQSTIYELCPHHQLCKYALPNISKVEDQNTCCTNCLCNNNCGNDEKKVCCFPETSIPENVTNKQMECLPATFSQRSLPESIIIPHYNMVTDCPPGYLETFEENKIVVQSCKDNSLIQSLRPVFSEATNIIYKNRFCAQCHGENLFMPWTPYLICTGESIQVEISKDFLSPNCYIHFKYPGDLLDIQFHRCCSSTFSDLPNEPLVDRDTVSRLCEQGIYAPFSYINKDKEDVFVNIYCVMCNSVINSKICLGQNINNKGTAGTYLGLLDISLLDKKTVNKAMHRKKANMEACRTLDPGEQTCRELLCKSGQVLNQAGQCVYVSLHWLFERVHVVLKLSYGADSRNCSLYDLLENNDLNSHLKGGLPTSWTIHSYFNGRTLCDCTSRPVTKCDPYFVVLYSMEYNEHINQTFPQFLISVKKFLSEPWYFEINGSSVYLKSEFLNLNSVQDDAIWYIRNDPFNVLPYVTTDALPSSFQITKLFFCEQILLHKLEYDIYNVTYDGNDIMLIYTPEQGKIFLPGEYVLHERGDGSVYPRVCVTDTLFQKVTKSNAHSQNYGKFNSIFVTICTFIICCHGFYL